MQLQKEASSGRTTHQIQSIMKRIKNLKFFTLIAAMSFFIAGISLTSCREQKKEDKTEQQAEEAAEEEHPSADEHPSSEADSTAGEHPTKETDTTGGEHPDN
jgi:preprotein translocase subunit SecG